MQFFININGILMKLDCFLKLTQTGVYGTKAVIQIALDCSVAHFLADRETLNVVCLCNARLKSVASGNFLTGNSGDFLRSFCIFCSKNDSF